MMILCLVTSIGATCGPAGIKMPRKLLNHKGMHMHINRDSQLIDSYMV